MSCSCGDADTLELGTETGSLVVRVVPGEQSTPTLVLTEADEYGNPGDPIAWPSAPDLVFDDFTVTADLSPSQAPLEVVANAMATWTISDAQTAALVDYAPVRLRVNAQTWWSGVVQCQS